MIQGHSRQDLYFTLIIRTIGMTIFSGTFLTSKFIYNFVCFIYIPEVKMIQKGLAKVVKTPG